MNLNEAIQTDPTGAMTLNTRELSVVLWTSVFALWAFSKPELRHSVIGIFRIALHWKIASPVVITAAYAASVVWLLATVGFWKWTDLKDTVVWFIVSGGVVALSGIQMQSRVPTVQQILTDQLGALIVIEYLISTFTFPIWVELLLIPTVVAVALVQGVAQTKSEFASVRKATGCLLALIGFTVAGAALRQTFLALNQISLASVAREIALPIVLTVMLLPLAYAFFVISAYEQIFTRVDLGMKDAALRKYVRRRLFRLLLISPTRIRKFIDSHRGRFITATTREEVDHWLATTGAQGEPPKD